MVMFNMIYPPCSSITEKNLKTFIAVFSDSNKKLCSMEKFSPTILLFQYTKALSNNDKLRAFISPKITDLITFLDNNRKYAVYTGVDVHGIYLYLDMIGAPTTLTTSGQHSHHF